jgi:ParB-like chromosome segregation protein Spo0J
LAYTLHNIAANKENTTAKRADSIKALLSKIKIVNGFNERDFKREDVRLHIASIVSALIAGEPIPALVVWTNPETGDIELVDGECRYWAYTDFAKAYPDKFDGYVSVIAYQGTSAQRKALVAKSNSQLPLDPVQRGRVYLSLRDEHNMSRQEIALEMNKSLAHVDQHILLAGGSHEVHQEIEAGTISPTEAVKLIRDHGDDAPAELERRKEAAKELGKGRVTAKLAAPKKVAPSRPKVDMVVSNAVVLVNTLGKDLADSIADGYGLDDEIKVSADALADLIMAVREMQQAGKALDADKQMDLIGSGE